MTRPYVVYPPGWPHKARARDQLKGVSNMRDIEVDREMVFRSIVDAYWTARGLWADHKQALAAAAELARGFAARLVEGHPVPYSATVWLGEESLGYVGEAIEGGAQYHRRP